jgi:hypothetical protein
MSKQIEPTIFPAERLPAVFSCKFKVIVISSTRKIQGAVKVCERNIRLGIQGVIVKRGLGRYVAE